MHQNPIPYIKVQFYRSRMVCASVEREGCQNVLKTDSERQGQASLARDPKLTRSARREGEKQESEVSAR